MTTSNTYNTHIFYNLECLFKIIHYMYLLTNLTPSPPLDNIRVMVMMMMMKLPILPCAEKLELVLSTAHGDCLEARREHYQNSSVLDCVTKCSESAAHLYEQFLQVKQIGFVTLGPLRCA